MSYLTRQCMVPLILERKKLYLTKILSCHKSAKRKKNGLKKITRILNLIKKESSEEGVRIL